MLASFNVNLAFGTFLAGTLALLFSGCVPHVKHLKTHIRDGAYDKALASVAGDEKMERELAALLLEDAAQRENASPELVADLARAGSPGRRALQRLVKAEDAVVGELAGIALQRGETPDAPDLVRWLHHDHSDVRQAAAKAWYAALDMTMLSRLVVDHSPLVRLYAVKGVAGQPAGPEVSRILSEVLRLDPVPKVRAEAARHGARLGDEAYRLLKQALGHANLGVRLAAIEGLADTGEAPAIDLLEDMVTVPVSEESVAAAAELSRMGRASGWPHLEEALSDERPKIRLAVLLRLERAAVKKRRQIFEDHLTDDAPEVVLLVAGLLRNDNDRRKKVMKALKGIAKNEDSHYERATAALAALGDPDALGVLEERLLSDETADVVSILVKVKGVLPLRAAFVSLLGDGREPVRIEAARALLSLGS